MPDPEPRLYSVLAGDGRKLLVRQDGSLATSADCCCGECYRCLKADEWDCQYVTQEECEECTRVYECLELVESECDGTCLDGFTGPGTNVWLSFSGCGGTGGVAEVVIGCGQILSATVTIGGSGYAVLGRVAPTVSASAGGGGSAATLAVSLATATDECNLPYWVVSSVSVSSGGSGYSDGDPVSFSVASGDSLEWHATATVTVSGGAITGVTVAGGGYYYREDAGQPGLAMPVTVTVHKGSGEPGSGATFTANVSTTAGATFGTVTSVTVTNSGSGYVALCERRREQADCSDCPPRELPEQSYCTLLSEEGACGTWTGPFPCIELPCCDTCMPPCTPTLNVTEETSDYIKTSSVGGEPPAWYDWTLNDLWLEAHGECNIVWVSDYVSQTRETGAYCRDFYTGQIEDENAPGYPEDYVPSNGCVVAPGRRALICPGTARKFWVRMRLFLVNCATRTLRDVTDEALEEPIEWEGCLTDSEYVCSGGLCGWVDVCEPDSCVGENPGFLDDEPVLECP